MPRRRRYAISAQEIGEFRPGDTLTMRDLEGEFTVRQFTASTGAVILRSRADGLEFITTAEKIFASLKWFEREDEHRTTFVPRVGEMVFSVEQLDAMPIGTRVMDTRFQYRNDHIYEKVGSEHWSVLRRSGATGRYVYGANIPVKSFENIERHHIYTAIPDQIPMFEEDMEKYTPRRQALAEAVNIAVKEAETRPQNRTPYAVCPVCQVGSDYPRQIGVDPIRLEKTEIVCVRCEKEARVHPGTGVEAAGPPSCPECGQGLQSHAAYGWKFFHEHVFGVCKPPPPGSCSLIGAAFERDGKLTAECAAIIARKKTERLHLQTDADMQARHMGLVGGPIPTPKQK